MKNTTDYDLPETWGLMSDEEKSAWYVRERVFRQAIGQDTTFGKRYRQQKEEQERLDTDQYRYDP